MALQMLSQLQKGVIAEVSDSVCLWKKVKLHLDFLPPGNKIDSLLAQKKENCYWVICNLHRPNLVNLFVTQTKVRIAVL